MADRSGEPGILRPGLSSRHFDYRRHEAPAGLADSLRNLWTITWDLPAGETFTAQVLPYPSVNLSFTNTEADVTGLVRRRYDRQLSGRGYAVGARFRPGCFRPFIDFPVSQLTDRHRPIAEVLGLDTGGLADQIGTEPDIDHRVALLVDFLESVRPATDPSAQRLAALVEQVAADRQITRVSQMASLAGSTVRRLQRQFAVYVGAGPKWVIQRRRLQDVAAQAAADEPVDWAQLATDLGFSDQAHLTRAFTATVGTSPAAYSEQARSS